MVSVQPLTVLEEIKKRLAEKTNRDAGEQEALDFIPKFHDLMLRPMKTEQEQEMVDIVILKYKAPEAEKECLRRIIENTDWPYRITWYDNRNNTANFAKIWNRLTEQSTCDYVLIMDTDAFCEQGWLTHMMKTMKANPNCAVVVPSCGDINSVTTIQGKVGLHEAPLEFRGHVSGFCFLFRKKAWEQIGPFDENFYMFGQDSDWFERILRNDFGWTIWICPPARVYHGNEKIGYSISTQQAAKDGEVHWDLDAEYSRTRFTKKYAEA